MEGLSHEYNRMTSEGPVSHLFRVYKSAAILKAALCGQSVIILISGVFMCSRYLQKNENHIAFYIA